MLANAAGHKPLASAKGAVFDERVGRIGLQRNGVVAIVNVVTTESNVIGEQCVGVICVPCRRGVLARAIYIYAFQRTLLDL